MSLLIEELNSETDHKARNAIALQLSSTKDPLVLAALMNLISRPDLENDRATLVHCLANFDCSSHFLFLVNLVINGNWEVSHEAFGILNTIDSLSDSQTSDGFKVLSETLENEIGESWRKVLIEDLLSMFE